MSQFLIYDSRISQRPASIDRSNDEFSSLHERISARRPLAQGVRARIKYHSPKISECVPVRTKYRSLPSIL